MHNGNDVNVKLPLQAKLISEATSYINKQQYLLDYNPTTLGYCWINDNKCLRTAKGLILKRVKKEQPIQAQSSINNKLTYQIVDWQKSVKPTGERKYTFDKISQINGILNKTNDNTWYLEIAGRKFTILKDELEFFYEYVMVHH
ncbi:MAG: hypothetical protein L3J29_13235 [Cyclobacteriaceae bacterium]|nr:hypothetical protein [Cyclobacteriaceae bacterium]